MKKRSFFKRGIRFALWLKYRYEILVMGPPRIRVDFGRKS